MTSMKLAKLRLTPERFDLAVAELILCVGGVFVMACGFYKIGRMSLSEAELFLSVLLVLAVGLLVIGLAAVMNLRRLILETQQV